MHRDTNKNICKECKVVANKPMKKNAFFAGIFVVLLALGSCKKGEVYSNIEGQTMGSYYSIQYSKTQQSADALQQEIDSLLVDFNKLFSTYDPTSHLSRWNIKQSKCDTLLHAAWHSQWKEMMDLSMQAYKFTDGAFNPALGPLFGYWGFGDTNKHPSSVDSLKISQLLKVCNFDSIYTKQQILCNTFTEEVQLNFNAIAAGYACELISEFLEQKNIQNYLINITGEIKAKGLNSKGKEWKISIEEPIENPELNPPIILVNLNQTSLATSGNYRNFFETSGKKYRHSINPATGFPAQNGMLSASIKHPNAALCDALATACMVLGPEKAKDLIEKHKEIEGFLVWNQNEEMKTWKSKGF